MPGFYYFVAPERRPKVPVGPRPRAFPRGLERPTYRQNFYASSCCRVNARFWCILQLARTIATFTHPARVFHAFSTSYV
jgi:hypothetical protein